MPSLISCKIRIKIARKGGRSLLSVVFLRWQVACRVFGFQARTLLWAPHVPPGVAGQSAYRNSWGVQMVKEQTSQ